MIEVPRLSAQVFTVLHSFNSFTDGSSPNFGLFLSGNTLYGSTFSGGANGNGTIFAIHTDGTGFSVISSLSSSNGVLGPSSLIVSGGTIFGTSQQGGSNYEGTVFSTALSDTSVETLHIFNSTGGSFPVAALVLKDNTLYGTAPSGGSNNNGAVFSVGTNGSNFKSLHDFGGFGFTPSTNLDGAGPQAGLLVSGGTLYGVTSGGGTNSDGTVFSINTDGTDFQALHQFFSAYDGRRSEGSLVLLGDTLYGTTSQGGTNNSGTIFSINTNGTGFKVLHTFESRNNYPGTNLDGASPESGLAFTGNTIFGTTYFGGAYQHGTIFMLNTDGSGFTTLHNFPLNYSDGDGNPQSSLVFARNTLYGAANVNGTNGNGVVFGLTIVPSISGISLIGTNLLVHATRGLATHVYTLLGATNAALPVNQWIPLATNVLTSGGNFVITATNAVNPESRQQFYMLQVE